MTDVSSKEEVTKLDASKVLGVAIKRGSLMFWLDKPARHGELIEKMAKSGIPTPIGHGEDVQGFSTVDGFKTRRETGALVGRAGCSIFSEDLW